MGLEDEVKALKDEVERLKEVVKTLTEALKVATERDEQAKAYIAKVDALLHEL